MKTLFSKFLKRVDARLPSEFRTSAETLLRVRTTLLYFLIDACYCTLYLLVKVLMGDLASFDTAMAVFYGLIGWTFIALIFRSYSTSKVFLFYMSIAFIVTILDICVFSHAYFSPGTLSYLSNILFFCLMIPELGKRTVLLIFALSSTLISFAILRTRASVLLMPPELTGTYALTISASVSIGFIVLIYLYLKIKSIAQDDLDQEVEWQMRSTRLNEIATMTATMAPLMDRPLQELARELHGFGQGGEWEPDIKKIAPALGELIEISQSFGWIYRAYRYEGLCLAPASQLFKHIQILISFKLKVKGWSLRTSPPQTSFEMQGPIPSMMLLVFSCIIKVLENEQPDEHRQLSIGLERREDSATWTLSWPEIRSHKAPDATSLLLPWNDLIYDLAHVSGAEIEKRRVDNANYLYIKGDWAVGR